jgi:molecular chaperone IbpA
VIVKSANIENGVLKISLENIVPEEKKPRKIEIGFVDKPLISNKK